MMSYDVFIVGDLIISVSVAWISPMPFGRRIEEESETVLDDRSSANEMSSLEASKEEGDDEYMGEACILNVPSRLSRPWQLRAHQDAPLSSCALLIFSIFFG